MFLLLALSCADTPSDAAPEAGPPPPRPAVQGVSIEDLNALEDRMERRFNGLDERVAELELALSEQQQNPYAGQANAIAFDPSRTTLESRELQGAVDELEDRITAVEHLAAPSMGAPGEGLFRIPKDEPKGGPKGGGPPPGGPGGPPPGGAGAGPPPGGG